MGIATAYATAAGDITGSLAFNNVDVVSPIDITFTNGVTMRWLKDNGYTNDFESACLLDSDSDGFLNWQEYQADTNPTNGSSFLSLEISGTNLTFAASSNCMYAIEWSGSLSSSNAWNTLTNNLVGVDDQMNVSDAAGATNRFYRLKAWLRID